VFGRSLVAPSLLVRPRHAIRWTATVSLLLGAAACDGKSASGARGDGAAAGGSTAATANGAKRDSLAAWRARFGNRVPRPDSVRALYVNAWAAGSHSRMAELIRIADETEVNAFIIDVKESDTFLAYDSTAIPLAKEIGADTRPATKWMDQLVDTLQAHGIYPIARIVVFKDRMLAEKKPELAIRHVNGGVWRDNKGGAWVNPYDKRVWDYNIAIAREALDMGFSELQWDYVRFPDVTDRMRPTMSYPGSEGKTRADNIRDFILYAKQQLADFQVPIAADVFGLVTHLEDDVGIGQNWEKVITAADVVLPMTYPSHYYAGLYGMARPGANPYQIVRLAMTDAVERTKFLADSAGTKVGEVMPWLEAMSIRGLTFGPREVRLQIQATYDAGLKSWALWNPGSKYGEFLGALRPQAGGKSPIENSGLNVPQWTLPRGQLSKVIQKRVARAQAGTAADSTKVAPSDSGARPASPPSPGSRGSR
jgi:hypothetical protein